MGEPALLEQIDDARAAELDAQTVDRLELGDETPDLSGVDLRAHFRQLPGLEARGLRDYLARICLLARQYGYCFIRQKPLAAQLDVSVRTVIGYQKTAESAGYILVKRTGRSNEVTPHWERLRLLGGEAADQTCSNFSSRLLTTSEAQAAAGAARDPRARTRTMQPDRERCSDAAAPSEASRPAAPVPRAPTMPPPAARPKAVSRPALEADVPALDPQLKAALCALTGGAAALRVLARAELESAAAVRVVERVLEVDRQRGVQHAAKFIHGPIADERAAATRELEQEAAKRHERDEAWERENERRLAAIAVTRQRCYESPPPKPMPPCDPRETRVAELRALLTLPWNGPGTAKRPALERELAEAEAALRSRMPGS